MKSVHPLGLFRYMQQIKSKAFFFAFSLVTLSYSIPASTATNNNKAIACHAAYIHTRGNNVTEESARPFNMGLINSIFTLSGGSATPHQIYIQVFRSIDQADENVCSAENKFNADTINII